MEFEYPESNVDFLTRFNVNGYPQLLDLLRTDEMSALNFGAMLVDFAIDTLLMGEVDEDQEETLDAMRELRVFSVIVPEGKAERGTPAVPFTSFVYLPESDGYIATLRIPEKFILEGLINIRPEFVAEVICHLTLLMCIMNDEDPLTINEDNRVIIKREFNIQFNEVIGDVMHAIGFDYERYNAEAGNTSHEMLYRSILYFYDYDTIIEPDYFEGCYPEDLEISTTFSLN